MPGTLRTPVRVGAAWVTLVLVTAIAAVAAVSGQQAGSAEPAPPGRSESAAAVRARPPLLLPNARALVARQLYIARDGSGQRRLRFESGLANVGPGVLEVRPDDRGDCRAGQQHASQVLFRDQDRNGVFNRRFDRRSVRRDAGCMLFHPRHDHWHFEAAARYALWDPDRAREPVVVQRRKLSFCLRDTERTPARWPTRSYPQFYGDCSQRSPQGISIGWVDIYGNYLPGQSLNLRKGLPDDLYCLRTTVDPRDQLQESDDSDNHSVRAVRIRGERVAARPARRCRGVG